MPGCRPVSYTHLDVYKRQVYKCFVLCQPLEGAFAPNLETMDCGFFALEDLPELSTGRVVREQLELCLQAAKQPEFIPQFD